MFSWFFLPVTWLRNLYPEKSSLSFGLFWIYIVLVELNPRFIIARMNITEVAVVYKWKFENPVEKLLIFKNSPKLKKINIALEIWNKTPKIFTVRDGGSFLCGFRVVFGQPVFDL